MPIYIRAGAIIPMGPVKQFSEERSDEPVLLKIFPGANGHCRWYDDDGASFAYEKGEYMLVDCEWDDKRRVLALTRDAAGSLGVGRRVRVELAGGGVKTVLLSNQKVHVEL